MIFDLTTMFSNAQAVTASAASTDILDMGVPGRVFGAAADLVRDYGKGQGLIINLQVVEGFNTLTSLTFALQCDDNAAFSSPKTLIEQTVPLARLIAGFKSGIVAVPSGANERFLRVFYTVTGVAPTLGKITAGLVLGQQTNAVSF